MEKTKFDDWAEVKDCNSCDHYWNDTCDGVPEGQKRNCTAFVATRSVVIPEQIKSLRKALNHLWFSHACLIAIVVIMIVERWL